jgi:hypothetical protein
MKFFLFFFTFFGSYQVFADFKPYQGAISAATAGSGRASAEATVSPYLNPATLAFISGYHFTTSYSYIKDQQSDFVLSLTDAMKDTVVPTSLGYLQTQLKNAESDVQIKDLRLAFGEIFKRKWSFGLAAHYLNHKTSEDSYGQTNLTLAFAHAFNSNLSFGAVFDDVLPASNEIPKQWQLQSKTALAVSYDYKKVVRGKLDYLSGGNNRFDKPEVLAGVESYLNKWTIIRLGLGHSFEKNTSSTAAGIGFKGPKFGIHYAFLRDFNLETRHSVDLGIPVW